MVDDSYNPGTWDIFLHNVEIAVLNEHPEISTTSDTAFRRDMDKIFALLAVVDNNSPSTIGGGGTPLQLLAPQFVT